MKKGMFLKARKSFLGRVLRRLLGEEKGAVMMEYIVVGLLIAAAAVVAVSVFGSTVSGMFGVLTNSVTNQNDTAMNRLQNGVRPSANAGIEAAAIHVGSNINADNAAGGAGTWGTVGG